MNIFISKNALKAENNFYVYRNFLYVASSQSLQNFVKEMRKIKINEKIDYYGLLSTSALKISSTITGKTITGKTIEDMKINLDNIGIILILKNTPYICPPSESTQLIPGVVKNEILFHPGKLQKISIDITPFSLKNGTLDSKKNIIAPMRA